MTPLEQTRLEKALFDHGFDLTPTLEAGWLVGRSTQHPISARLGYEADGAITLASINDKLRTALQREHFECQGDDANQEPALWWVSMPDYTAFHKVLGRFAALARSLPNQVAARFASATKGMPNSTEAERLVVQRVGQYLFREALIDYWQGRCAVTDLDVAPLLRASHIKPWARCDSNEERLDVFNGLLLAPHLDALFDGGWIGFLDDGELVVCSELTEEQRRLLALHPGLHLNSITDQHRVYLAFHRSFVFRA